MHTTSKKSSKQSPGKITLRSIRKWVNNGETFPMLTCYDATTAGHLWRGGVQTLLVGDTAAQFILGHSNTLSAKMPFMLEITAAVRRGAPEAFVMADMPFGSYHCGDDLAMANAVAFMQEAKADAVKFELTRSQAPLVKRLSEAGVPVVAHLGSRPQQKAVQGQCRLKIRDKEQVQEIVQDAVTMVEHGAVMILLEAVPHEVSQAVIQAIKPLRKEPVPVIGCGAGPACHGHVVVLHDLLGLTDWHAPFAPPAAQIGSAIADAAAHWRQTVQSGEYLKENHPYEIE